MVCGVSMSASEAVSSGAGLSSSSLWKQERKKYLCFSSRAHAGKDRIRIYHWIEQDKRQDNTVEQDRTGRVETGRDETRRDGQDRTGQDRTGQDRTGQERTGLAGQDRTGQDRYKNRKNRKTTNKKNRIGKFRI
jgi:hypothetical protein